MAALVIAFASLVMALFARPESPKSCLGDCRRGRGSGVGGRYPLFEELEFTTAQRRFWIVALREHALNVEPTLVSERVLREAIKENLDSVAPDAKALGRDVIALHMLISQMAAACDELELGLIEVLSAEQRSRLAPPQFSCARADIHDWAWRASGDESASETLQQDASGDITDQVMPQFGRSAARRA